MEIDEDHPMMQDKDFLQNTEFSDLKFKDFPN